MSNNTDPTPGNPAKDPKKQPAPKAVTDAASESLAGLSGVSPPVSTSHTPPVAGEPSSGFWSQTPPTEASSSSSLFGGVAPAQPASGSGIDSGVAPPAEPVSSTDSAAMAVGNLEPLSPVLPASGWLESQAGDLPLQPKVAPPGRVPSVQRTAPSA